MKSSNKDVRKMIDESAPIFQAARRADIILQIRSKMLEKGLRNLDIAERLGVSEANVSRWLRGNQNISIDTIYQLADAIEESIQIIIGAEVMNVTDEIDVSGDRVNNGWSTQQESKAASVSLDESERRAGVFDGFVYDLSIYRSMRAQAAQPSQFIAARSEVGIFIDDERERMCN